MGDPNNENDPFLRRQCDHHHSTLYPLMYEASSYRYTAPRNMRRNTRAPSLQDNPSSSPQRCKGTPEEHSTHILSAPSLARRFKYIGAPFSNFNPE